jgi:hypothetical protein
MSRDWIEHRNKRVFLCLALFVSYFFTSQSMHNSISCSAESAFEIQIRGRYSYSLALCSWFLPSVVGILPFSKWGGFFFETIRPGRLSLPSVAYDNNLWAVWGRKLRLFLFRKINFNYVVLYQNTSASSKLECFSPLVLKQESPSCAGIFHRNT